LSHVASRSATAFEFRRKEESEIWVLSAIMAIKKNGKN
jgi:hypothetical protein